MRKLILAPSSAALLTYSKCQLRTRSLEYQRDVERQRAIIIKIILKPSSLTSLSIRVGFCSTQLKDAAPRGIESKCWSVSPDTMLAAELTGSVSKGHMLVLCASVFRSGAV